MWLAKDRVQTPHRWKARHRKVQSVACAVIHWTAANPRGSEDRVRSWLAGHGAKTSTHFVILRDGQLIQAADTEDRTWHAGESALVLPGKAPRKSVNRFSIGIDLDNVGPLTRKGGHLVDWAGRRYVGPVVDIGGRLFEPYTEAQMATLSWLLHELGEAYPILREPGRIVGHQHVSPGRKQDPGPCLPWARIREAVSADWIAESSTDWGEGVCP